MSFFQKDLWISTRGRALLDITDAVNQQVSDSQIAIGLCHIFCAHTSASLTLTENADPRVHDDLEEFMARLAPDGDPNYSHRSEGDDDMPAHIRSVVTDSSLMVPVSAGQLALGTWQGVYLWEHRFDAHRRQVVVTVSGDMGI